MEVISPPAPSRRETLRLSHGSGLSTVAGHDGITTRRGTAMPDTTPVVRWRRKGRKGRTGSHRYTRWHVCVVLYPDDTAQTACGIVYARRDAEIGTAGDGELCRNCQRGIAAETELAA